MERKKPPINYHPEDTYLLERGDQLYNRKADLILTSDWHIREDTPTCWTGNFLDEQWINMQCIKNLQKKHGCAVFHAGDLFHHWKPSPWLLSKTVQFLPDCFVTVYGQHDLPQHNMELKEKSGMHNLMINGKLAILEQGHWGWEPKGGKGFIIKDKEVIVWHHLTYLSKPFPGAEGGMAEGLLRTYPQYHLIVTGDNHQSFSVQYKDRLLVNPGPITRQTADQADFQPRVALWYGDTNTIEWVELPKQDNVITREHIEQKEERDYRIQAFVSRLDGNWEVEMSFEQNLQSFEKINKIRQSVMEIVYKSIEV